MVNWYAANVVLGVVAPPLTPGVWLVHGGRLKRSARAVRAQFNYLGV